jgi:hypothetical protein
MISSEFKEELIKYSELYFELGILEKLLRVTIPAILTTKVGASHVNGWISMLTLDVKSQGFPIPIKSHVIMMLERVLVISKLLKKECTLQ